MYCDILKDLLNQIDRVLNGNNQLEENARKSLYSLMESLDSLIGTTQLQEEKKGGDAVLNAESANTLRAACDDFTKKCNEFRQNMMSIAADVNNYLQRAEKSVVSTKKVDADGEKKLLQVFRNIEGGTGRQTII